MPGLIVCNSAEVTKKEMSTDTIKINASNDNSPGSNNRERLSVLNIGQVLFLAFLFMTLLLQFINIYANNSAELTSRTGLGLTSADNAAAVDNNLSPSQLDTDNSSSGSDDIGGKSGIVFILGEYQGKLAILSSDRTIAYEVFDVYIDTLPDYDRTLLSKGIEIKSAEELRSLLEDYSS